MNFPVFDFHCDTALMLLGDDLNQAGSLRKNNGHIDLERAVKLGGYAQCFACFTTDIPELLHGISPIVLFERELATIQREVDKNCDLISIAYSPEEIEENREAGKMSAILTLEGTAGFGYDPALLEDLYAVGFRITSLGWNEQNPLTGSHVTGGGLTDRGREYVREAQRLGMLVDVSHISDEGFWDIMKITEAPIIATHSNSRAVWNNSRNLTDDMFRAIRDTGGVVGLNFYQAFVGEDPSMDALVAHVEHFLALGGEKTLCIGSDMDGCELLAGGMAGLQDVPRLYNALAERGYGHQLLEDIFWNNLRRLL